ncbi:excisionase family DNA-binding protein [Crossiella sp. SN42]|uniref:excisionase family DNA-binding protein n=1 Tax=Crossiella sp. SN42 TaxID=2944808 RepID=UPI00207D110F|nr:excisionase family DNA-binding protein [Crossiella sp. SN42]MCO1575473.1 excisionase family DNA-binding protein [Crossiella sp. SN42]
MSESAQRHSLSRPGDAVDSAAERLDRFLAYLATDAVDGASSDPDALFTPEQAAGLLQIPTRTLQEKLAAGIWPHVRLGKHYRLSRTDVRAIVQQCHVGGGVKRPRRTYD